MSEFPYSPRQDRRSLVERLADIDPSDHAAVQREIDAENWAYHIERAGFGSLTPEQQAAYVDSGLDRLADSLPEIRGEM